VFDEETDELVHGFVDFVEEFLVGFGESGVAAVVFGFIPGAFENFSEGGGGGVVALLRGIEGESGEGAIRAHLGVVHAGGLRGFCLSESRIGEEKN